MDKAGPSRSRRSRSRRSRTQITPDGDVRSVQSRDEDWDVPQAQKKLKGKAIQPEGSWRSVFQRLGHEGRNQNRPAKERLGVETTPLSAFDRLGRGAERPGRTRRTEPPHREEPQYSRAPHEEEEAESHPRHTIRSHVEQPRDRTLRGRAVEWFHNLPAGEIDSFDELAEVFQEKFKENCTKRKKFTYLSTAGQWEHEDLTKFLTWWKDEVDKLEEMDDKTAMSLFVSRLWSGELYKEFCRRSPQSYQEAYNTAWDYADAEAHVSFKMEAEQGHPKGRISLKKGIELPGKVKTEIMEVKPFKTEKKLTGEKQWTEKYCSFHKTGSQNTTECNSVKGVIKQMIEAGEIDPEYLAQAKQRKNQWIRPEGQPAEQNKKKKAAGKEHLQVIYGGPEGGDSASQRKKWGRELYVGTVALNPWSKQARREPITFTDRDLPATGEDHNDPLAITMDMGGVDVSRVLVDTGSSVNNLYLDAFEKLKLCRTRLEPLKTPLSGFTGDSVEAEGSILLTCELGTGDQVVQKQMRFVVVNIKCVHNAILGRPGINKVRGVISMAHLCMKFYTPGGIGQEEERSKLEPGDETEQIVLRETLSETMVRIGRDLPGGIREEIISVLREYADIFAWSVADMSGIDRSVICHRLAVMEVGQINGEMEVKEERLARYSDLVRALLRELEEFRLTRIPRSENTDADMLSKLMQSCPGHVSKLAKIEILDQPSTDRFEVVAVQQGQSSATGVIEADDDWRYDLMEYLMTGRKPNDEERAKKVVLRAPQFQVLGGHLYKRAIGGPLLRCLTNSEAERVIAEVHEGVCAAHQMSHTLAQRIILLGYYWPTIVRDCERVTSRRATGETPFVLTYGCEAWLPTEAEFPTFRETVYQPCQNEVDHLAELNLVEERRTLAAVKMANYQRSIKRYHDNRVGPRYFQVHDEVLRRRDASEPNERGKLVRNWEGPYRIKAIIRPGTYQMESMEGGRVNRHWNSHHLRKFFR
ncbi:unnamed protein product [Cuscuta campestris]|uniref:Retrotransposon gag domain-containing protein n=1 Tax=Cuscuta campestris TaxID=132261 RepID=A0A484KFP6_9ASTE|nr:unnamed protein product [Cuscuta campestris]